MKSILAPLSFLIASAAWAQFTVAPFGASGVASPPIGKSNGARCAYGNCALEIKVEPYCFGTNLRAYPQNTQLRPDGQVSVALELTHPSDPSKKDQIRVEFPGNMTYASEGVRLDCQFDGESPQSLQQPGYKNIKCRIPWLNNSIVKYKLSNWLSENITNNGAYHPEYSKYAARVLPAQLIGTNNNLDSDINCLYKFTNNNPWSAQLVRTAVSCYFPSRLPDLSNTVKVFKNDVEVTNSVALRATTNNISFKFEGGLNSVPTEVAVKHGKVVGETLPSVAVNFSQNSNELAAIREKLAYSQNPDDRRYEVVAKFPGTEGFCGGFYSPLMFFFDKQTPRFNGVSLFPLYGVKEGGRVHWPEAGAPGYFLARLKKGEDKIARNDQLFGKTDKYENGFEALKIHDSNKDGVITKADAVWNELRLWNDRNGDGVSDSSEITTLAKMGVKSIDLKYGTRDVTKFDNRARAREKSKFTFEDNGKIVKADVFDVWLAPID